MHPHLEHVFARLDRSRAALRAAVEAVPAHSRSARPDPERWSAAEVVEHLSIVERTFGGWIDKALTQRAEQLTRELADRAALPAPIEARMADRVNRRNAPEAARPSGSVSCDDGLKHLESGHERLRSIVSAADGLALSEVTVDHPFFGSLTVYQWIELIAAHESRHTEQIKEIAVALAV
jgi:DinB family protein